MGWQETWETAAGSRASEPDSVASLPSELGPVTVCLRGAVLVAELVTVEESFDWACSVRFDLDALEGPESFLPKVHFDGRVPEWREAVWATGAWHAMWRAAQGFCAVEAAKVRHLLSARAEGLRSEASACKRRLRAARRLLESSARGSGERMVAAGRVVSCSEDLARIEKASGMIRALLDCAKTGKAPEVAEPFSGWPSRRILTAFGPATATPQVDGTVLIEVTEDDGVAVGGSPACLFAEAGRFEGELDLQFFLARSPDGRAAGGALEEAMANMAQQALARYVVQEAKLDWKVARYASALQSRYASEHVALADFLCGSTAGEMRAVEVDGAVIDIERSVDGFLLAGYSSRPDRIGGVTRFEADVRMSHGDWAMVSCSAKVAGGDDGGTAEEIPVLAAVAVLARKAVNRAFGPFLTVIPGGLGAAGARAEAASGA